MARLRIFSGGRFRVIRATPGWIAQTILVSSDDILNSSPNQCGGKRGQVQFVRSTLWAVPANWTCPLFPQVVESALWSRDALYVTWSPGTRKSCATLPCARLLDTRKSPVRIQ